MRTAALASFPPMLTARERTHRRLTLLAIAALLVLGVSPAVGHHLPLDTTTFLAGLDHVGAVCVTALHHLLAPVHGVYHIVLLAGLCFALWDRVVAWRRMRRTLGPLPVRLPRAGDSFWLAAVSAGLDPGRVRIVRGLPTPAFTVGVLSPVVYVAESLIGRLSAAQVAAVLAHERAHLVRRDPLRQSLLRALACTLFWIPALRRLADDMADDAEVLADDAASGSQPLVLASAILALAHGPARMKHSGAEVGFDQPDLLDRRIRRLAGEDAVVSSHVTRRSLAAAGAALSMVWLAGLLMVHPLPAASLGQHCDHRGESALAHLFCLGSPVKRLAEHCPHQHT